MEGEHADDDGDDELGEFDDEGIWDGLKFSETRSLYQTSSEVNTTRMMATSRRRLGGRFMSAMRFRSWLRDSLQ